MNRRDLGRHRAALRPQDVGAGSPVIAICEVRLDMHAYEDAIRETAAEHAPGYVVPADDHAKRIDLAAARRALPRSG